MPAEHGALSMPFTGWLQAQTARRALVLCRLPGPLPGAEATLSSGQPMLLSAALNRRRKKQSPRLDLVSE